MFNSKRGQVIDIPRPEELNPVIAEIRERLTQLRTERAAAVTEEQEWASQVSEDDAARLQQDRVAQLLGKSPSTIPVTRAERRRELQQTIFDIDRAAETLENALTGEITRANALASERVAATYRKAVAGLHDSLATVLSAYAAAERVQNEFSDLGYSAANLTVHASHILRGGDFSDVAILRDDLKKWAASK